MITKEWDIIVYLNLLKLTNFGFNLNLCTTPIKLNIVVNNYIFYKKKSIIIGSIYIFMISKEWDIVIVYLYLLKLN
jgi:hypothetical protein